MAEAGPHSGQLVRRDGRPNARAAEQNAALDSPRLNGLANGGRNVGVIVRLRWVVCPQVKDIVTLPFENHDQILLEVEGGVVAADRDQHGSPSILMRGAGACVPREKRSITTFIDHIRASADVIAR